MVETFTFLIMINSLPTQVVPVSAPTPPPSTTLTPSQEQALLILADPTLQPAEDEILLDGPPPSNSTDEFSEDD